jgi:hypothetical protein
MTKEDMKTYYVYLHKRKGTNKVFYVGKGTKSKGGIDRIESHKNRNNWWQHIVEKDGGFDYEIYSDNLTEETAFELETKLINQIGIENLVNITIGGMGGDTLTHHPNIEQIGKKISDANTGDKNGNYGKGYYYWWVKKYGKEKADEMLFEFGNKISKANKGIIKGPNPKLAGDNNPSKKPESRKKISDWAKDRVRKKVKCDLCSKEVPDTHLQRHKLSKKCKKN